jgi:hypothetical protein
VVRQIGAFADRLVLETNPAVQACRRMRLSGEAHMNANVADTGLQLQSLITRTASSGYRSRE